MTSMSAFEMASMTAQHQLRLMTKVVNKMKNSGNAKRLVITEEFDFFDPADQLVADLTKHMLEQVRILETDGYRNIKIVHNYDGYLMYQGTRDETDAEMAKRMERQHRTAKQNKAQKDKKAQQAAQSIFKDMTRKEALAAWEAAQTKKKP